jgi:Nucleotidyl transferase AbiEii toxin, Type IV TA system
MEFAMNEKVPLAEIFRLVFTVLSEHDDVSVYGSQALNVYVKPPRMTEDIDVFSQHAPELAETLRDTINRTFHVAIRIRRSADGKGLRLYQTTRESKRHLIDIRPTVDLPPTVRMNGVGVVVPAFLAAMKVIASVDRANLLDREQDTIDLRKLLAAIPELRTDPDVDKYLSDLNASPDALAKWEDLRTSQTPKRMRETARPEYRRR